MRIEWSWTKTDPLAVGDDAIDLVWGSDDVVAQEGLLRLPGGTRTVAWPYDEDGPPNPAVGALLDEHGDGSGLMFSVPRRTADAGGRIEVPFDATSREPTTLNFVARYARGTQWRTAAVIACDLPLPTTNP